MQNDVQNTINQLSLVMTIPEDIVKACKQNDFSPAMTETLLRLHDQQTQMETAINVLRSEMVAMAKVIEQSVDTTTNIFHNLNHMGKQLGYNPEEHVSAEAIGQDT